MMRSLARGRAAAALETLVAAARLGGETALRHFRLGAPTSASVAYKAGDSPVTSADLEVDAQLAAVLRPAFPDAGWLSEETRGRSRPARKPPRLLVLDPIDGTRAFMSGDPCWTVAIALVEDGRPVAGVVHAPALGETFAAALGAGATLNGAPIRGGAARARSTARVVAGPRALGEGFRRRRRLPAGDRAAHALARLPARQRRRGPHRDRPRRRPIRTIGTSPPPTSFCARPARD